MKYLMGLLALVISLQVAAQPFVCGVPERAARSVPASVLAATPDGVICSKIFVQVAYDLVEEMGVDGAEAYAIDVMEQASVPFMDIDVALSFDIVLQTETTYENGGSNALLNQFQEQNPTFDGDVGLLLSGLSSGGIAYVGTACSEINPYRYAFANVGQDYRPFRDGYSWPVMVIAHELGHSFGSSHTQDCIWNGNNTPIDGCYQGRGDCEAGPIPSTGGTILSYCHLNPVGIDFSKKFHPQVAAVIRAGAYERCLTCDDPGGGNPPAADCDMNPLFVDIALDAWPDETSYFITDADGDTVHQAGPYTREMAGKVVSDTLCFFQGCYTFHIVDANGLGPNDEFPCVEGMYYVGDPFGEFGSGQSFTGDTTLTFCVGEPSDCYEIEPTELVSYSNQNRRGSSTLVGGELILTGNNWLAQLVDYQLTPNTVLSGYFMRGDTGEINGIGFTDQIQSIASGKVFQFGGTQGWGVQLGDIPANEWKYLEVPVGQLPEIEKAKYVTFVNDFDRNELSGNARTGFRDLELCESRVDGLPKAAVQGTVGDEDWNDSEAGMQEWIKKRIKEGYRPNPVDDVLELPTSGVWLLFNADGKQVDGGCSNKVNMAALPSGAYLLYHNGTTQKIAKK